MQRTAVCVFTTVKVSNLHIDLLMGFHIIICLDNTGRYPLPLGGNSIAVNKYHVKYHFTVELVGSHCDAHSKVCMY